VIESLSDECSHLVSEVVKLSRCAYQETEAMKVKEKELESFGKTQRSFSKRKEEVGCEVSEKEIEAKDDLLLLNGVAKLMALIANPPGKGARILCEREAGEYYEVSENDI
jgi:hypothetical protein